MKKKKKRQDKEGVYHEEYRGLERGTSKSDKKNRRKANQAILRKDYYPDTP